MLDEFNTARRHKVMNVTVVSNREKEYGCGAPKHVSPFETRARKIRVFRRRFRDVSRSSFPLGTSTSRSLSASWRTRTPGNGFSRSSTFSPSHRTRFVRPRDCAPSSSRKRTNSNMPRTTRNLPPRPSFETTSDRPGRRRAQARPSREGGCFYDNGDKYFKTARRRSRLAQVDSAPNL